MINETEYITQMMMQQSQNIPAEIPAIPPDAFYTTWEHIHQLAGITFAAGMIVGAICFYAAPKVASRIIVMINGEMTRREPHAQRSNHPATRDYEELDEEEKEAIV